jgi:hypothetical protein
MSLLVLVAVSFTSCDGFTKAATSDSGVKKASVTVQTDAQGHTVEQKNYMERLQRDNSTGSIKHLYIISSYTGDVLEYSTVKGKVTSGGKRLSPQTVSSSTGASITGASVNYINLAGTNYATDEVPDEYGMYGSSSQYFYWFDALGSYHQYYPSGGTFVHISDKPLRVRKASMTFSLDDDPVKKE